MKQPGKPWPRRRNFEDFELRSARLDRALRHPVIGAVSNCTGSVDGLVPSGWLVRVVVVVTRTHPDDIPERRSKAALVLIPHCFRHLSDAQPAFHQQGLCTLYAALDAVRLQGDTHRLTEQLVQLVPIGSQFGSQGLQGGWIREALPVGAHLSLSAPPALAEGFITSSAYSPALQQPIALALLKRGTQRMGERLQAWHLGKVIEAEVVRTPFVDPAGERIHG